MDVIVTSPVWSLNGVNVFSENLVRGLRRDGINAQLLLTHPDLPDLKPMPLPDDIPVNRLAVSKNACWNQRWQALINYLELRAPCIYFPNYDFWFSGISPKLSKDVIIIGNIHSDDPIHYDHAQRLGAYWNAIVSVSQFLGGQIKHRIPEFSDRSTTIPYGVYCPENFPRKATDNRKPLRIVYHGVLNQQQKRILDSARIVKELGRRNIDFKLTIIGDGPERSQLQATLSPFIDRGQVQILGIMAHSKIPSMLLKQDVYLLTSKYEGLPHALLEAMGQGCVPVVSDIHSGVHELIDDGEEGFIVPVGQIEAFVDRLEILTDNAARRNQMARKAYERVKEGYTLGSMVDKYTELFAKTIEAKNRGAYIRPEGKIIPPPFFTWKDYLPPALRKTARQFRQSISGRG